MSDLKNEDAALRHYKSVVREMLSLFQKAIGAKTISLHWVNRTRQQFVLESAVSDVSDVRFADRVAMADSFLNGYDTLTRPTTLDVGKDVPPSKLTHYLGNCPVTHITIQPLEYQRDVVALVAIESTSKSVLTDADKELESFSTAMGHLLFTFLELSERTNDEQQWSDYEAMLQKAIGRGDEIAVLERLVDMASSLIPTGSVSLLVRANGTWQVVLNHPGSTHTPAIGLPVEEQSLVFQALKTGQPEFATHLGGSPKRINSAEPIMKGASLAIPLLMHDRRQALLLVSDENLLFFRESNRHKLTNLVRIAALRLVSGTTKHIAGTDFLSAETGTLHADVFDAALLREMKPTPPVVAMVTVSHIPILRSRLRMEELKEVQRLIGDLLAPHRHGLSGLVGVHSDFVFTVMIHGDTGVENEYLSSVADLWKTMGTHPLDFIMVFSDRKETDPYSIKRGLRLALDQRLKEV
jgi:hypothetical protein